LLNRRRGKFKFEGLPQKSQVNCLPIRTPGKTLTGDPEGGEK